MDERRIEDYVLARQPNKPMMKKAVTGMKAYAYDNGQKFTNEEIIETAKKKMKDIFGASKDFEYLDWSIPR